MDQYESCGKWFAYHPGPQSGKEMGGTKAITLLFIILQSIHNSKAAKSGFGGTDGKKIGALKQREQLKIFKDKKHIHRSQTSFWTGGR